MRTEQEYEIENAVIESASILIDDHGCLTAWLSLKFSGSGQGFGGFALYLPTSFRHHSTESAAGHFIFRVLEIAGVIKWADLKGKTVRVNHSWSDCNAIGHIIKDDWFCPSEDFAKKGAKL